MKIKMMRKSSILFGTFNVLKIMGVVFGILLLLLSTYSECSELEHIDYHQLIQDIQIIGLENLSPDDIPCIEELRTKVGTTIKEQDLMRDMDLMYMSGFFNYIEAKTENAKNGIVLYFIVRENPVIRDVVIWGCSVVKTQIIRDLMLNKPGKVLNVKDLEHDKMAVSRYFYDHGYTLFLVKTITLSQDNDLLIEFSEGSVKDITFEGLQTIQSFVPKRTIRLKKGAVFNSELLREDRNRLLRLGYFSDVFLTKISELDENQIALTFRVKERKVNLFGIGLEQEEKLTVGFLAFNLNHVLMHTDFISAKTQFGYEDKVLGIRSYSLRYIQPWFLNQFTYSFAMDFWTKYVNESLTKDHSDPSRIIYEVERKGADIIFSFPIIEDQLNFITKAKTESVNPIDPVFATSDAKPYDIHSLSAIVSYSSLKDIHNPKAGSYWRAALEKGGNLGLFDIGGVDFSRYHLDAAAFIGLTSKVVFGMHGFVGVFNPDQNTISTFESEEYEIGGAMSLRGYKEYKAYAPFRGFREILFNFELRYDITDSFQGVVFYDFGKTFNGSWTFDVDEFMYGAGFGIRFFTPVGPLRFDFAWGEDFMLHFALGQLF
ncbi:outer membrane protein assembly factor [Thermoproteota archaeon]